MASIVRWVCLLFGMEGAAHAGVSYVELPAEIQGVVSYDVFAEDHVIHLLVAGRTATKGQGRVIYLYSPDSGKTWGKPRLVEQAASTNARFGNDVQLAARGRRILVAWQVRGDLPGTGPLRVVRSRDGGTSWEATAAPAPDDPTSSQSEADLSVDADGRFHLVWLDDREERGNTQGVRYARTDDLGRSWQVRNTVDAAACTCCWTRLVPHPGLSPLVLYRDDRPHDMRLAGFDPGRLQWQPLGAVGAFDWHFEGCPHCGGGLAAAQKGSGQAVLHAAVWTGKEGAAGLYYLRSGDLGRHWSAPFLIGGERSHGGDIAARSADSAAIVFSVPGTEESAVQIRESRDGGRSFDPARRLNAAGTKADHPRILWTASGYRVFWAERRWAGGAVLAMTSLP